MSINPSTFAGLISSPSASPLPFTSTDLVSFLSTSPSPFTSASLIFFPSASFLMLIVQDMIKPFYIRKPIIGADNRTAIMYTKEIL